MIHQTAYACAALGVGKDHDPVKAGLEELARETVVIVGFVEAFNHLHSKMAGADIYPYSLHLSFGAAALAEATYPTSAFITSDMYERWFTINQTERGFVIKMGTPGVNNGEMAPVYTVSVGNSGGFTIEAAILEDATKIDTIRTDNGKDVFGHFVNWINQNFTRPQREKIADMATKVNASKVALNIFDKPWANRYAPV